MKRKRFFYMYHDHGGTLHPHRATFDWGFEELARAHGYQYRAIPNGLDRVGAFGGPIIVVTQHADGSTPEQVRALLRRCPRCKFILIGTDVQYFGPVKNQPEHFPPEVALHVNTMAGEVAEVQACHGIPGEHFYWTLSGRAISLIESTYAELTMTEPVGRSRDAICLCRIAPEMQVRRQFFEALRSCGVDLAYNLSLYEPRDVVDAYRRSFVTLGTTTTCMCDFPGKRSMKGFRDWIGPLCDAPLIYDDYHEVVSGFGDIVPTYRYGYAQGVKRLIEDLRHDPECCSELICKQRVWIHRNAIEAQFDRIFLKHGIFE